MVYTIRKEERENNMNLYDIIGPVMVGPSSSHTAGAVRIGYISGKLLDEPVKSAKILLYGSFLATGTGHEAGRHKDSGQPDHRCGAEN